ncbi:MAG: glycosyltransferase family 2 protein [Myxococcales bacterium]|nr:glycosyltransferase family 2 protein [Myxococcales bacterium]
MTELLAGASAPDGSRLHGRAHAAIRSWGAGIVNHGGYDDLARCLESLAVQSRRPACVVVYDTGVSPERLECLRRDWPGVRFESGPNVGYAGGANRVVERLRDEAAPVDFVLLLNPDVLLEPDFAASLIDAMEACPEVVIATGKLLRADGVTIDSAGIVLPRHRRPRDRGSEQPDRGQYEARERVDAASGAAMMLRAGAIDGLTIEGELFDETFFAYHEDTDLCWRARRLGHVILYEPRAVARHARGWQKAARFRIPAAVRRHSFKNHYLQLVKNETLGGLLANGPWIVGWELLRLGFVLLRDREMLPAYREAWRLLPVARRRRRLVQARSARGRSEHIR